MGPGIFTKYSKEVLSVILVIFFAIAGVVTIAENRSPVGGMSPYDTVNDMYEWEHMTFAPEHAVYPGDTENIRFYFRNDAPDGVVVLSAEGTHFGYELEIWKDGAWHRMRTYQKHIRWEGKTDIVKWGGDEVLITCPVGKDYPSPLRPGLYRVVLPQCEHLKNPIVPLAAEFEVVK